MPALVIVESPAKAKTISRFLGPKYRVEASFGHVRDLPERGEDVPEEIKSKHWSRMAVDIDGDFTPYYVVSRDKAKHIAELKKHLKNSTELLLATDEDREGESISWHLLQILQPKVPVHRIVFHEITEEAIKEAVRSPREVDENLVKAQESRRILDRLYGYSLSPVLWKKIQGGLSAGRVQSVAVRLLVEREEERRAFVKSAYSSIEASLTSGPARFKAQLARHAGQRLAEGRDFDSATGKLKKDSKVFLLDAAGAVNLAQSLGAALPWRVSSVEEKPATRRPSAPFTTSTLQQEANRKLKFTAQRTMSIAQRLYEGVDLGHGEREGVITYMRTDSTTLSEKALGQAGRVIQELYGAEYHEGERRYKTKTRNAQEAHEAIRPTDLRRTPKELEPFLDGPELRLYELIWKRTIASQMADAKLLRTAIEITAEPRPGQQSILQANGTAILFPGFLRAYVEGSDDPSEALGDQETLLPKLSVGDLIGSTTDAKAAARLEKIEARNHETQPPARYTEASLVKKLEEEGIGRPSTYASIIGTIQDRGYVTRLSGALVPTFTAMAVVNLLREHFNEYVDLKFTARMEEDLDLIAEGSRESLAFLKAFFRDGDGDREGLLKRIADSEKRINFPTIPIGIDPASDLPMVARIGRYGPYLQRGEGGSDNIVTIPPETAPADLTVERALELLALKSQGPRVVGTHPDTGEPVFAAKGRFGAYVQLGEASTEKGAEKPRRASLPAGVSEDAVTLEQALQLLALPRTLGAHPDSGAEVVAGLGRYGPYVRHGEEFRSLEESDDVYTVDLARAVEIFASPKKFMRRQAAAPAAMAELGKHPASGAAVKVLSGRFGPYVTDGTTNATLPKSTKPEALTLEEALRLLEEKAAKGPSTKAPARGAGRAAGKGAAKAAPKAAAKAPPKSAGKAPAKKPARKTTKSGS